MAKPFRLGAKLHYPITIQRILKRPGETISKQDTILEYSFEWQRVTGDDTRDIEEVHKQVTTVTWVSPADGVLKDLFLKQGQVVPGDTTCVVIEETCGHEVQFQGMCAVCGKDMTEVNWATEERDTDRAPINMTHDHTNLTVSQAAAQRLATQQQTTLLQQRKLSLVVDLDQTIIHACIEPTVGEWQRDPNNPNYDAVKDVRSFQLNDEGPRGLATGCWYYIKLRPGLKEFLDKISEMYELHVYTMGTRAYAQNIARLVDPDQKLFGNRVISRDENGSLTAKSLERLFPTSTGMVAIIDDRADVWPKNRDNLIKVVPYDFFKGIGDINSSFLPKRQDIAPAPPAPSSNSKSSSNSSGAQNGKADGGTSSGMIETKKEPPKDANPDAESKKASSDQVSALEELVSMSGGNDTILRQKQSEEQAHLLEKQLTERPLLHLQEQLDKEEETANSTQTAAPADETPGDNTPSSQTSSQQRHNLLRDDDKELIYLTEHLTNLHHAFYDEYDHKRSSRAGPTHGAQSLGKLAAAMKDSKTDNSVDLSMIPDVGRVLSNLKRQVLAKTTIVLSGLVPLDIDVHKSEMGLQVKSFGANIHTRVSPRITHLVISIQRPRTQKVRQAARIPSINIVNQNWLADSMSQWKKLEPGPYAVCETGIKIAQELRTEDANAEQVEVHPADRIRPIKEVPEDTGADPSTPEGRRRRQPPGKLVLRVQNTQGQEVVLDDEDDGFDSDDEGLSHIGEDDEMDELVNYVPDDLADGESSPIDNMKTFNWGEADQELEDFLASGTEDDDDDDDGGDGDEPMKDSETDNDYTPRGLAVSNGNQRKLSLGLKRKLGDDQDDESDSGPESALAKRQRISAARSGSLLKNGRSATSWGDDTPTLPTPDDEDGGRNDDEDLEEADLLAMLEAEDSEKG
ncbi:putative FCP1-like phosphatase [Zalerion maritima]|uniref:RNA polymerase II subunit A C-terminal domain phosphatase n=1 Tax=Zalerion maritima TaxID=339359 RepID=A0AAD5WPX6_9PEZI|nr:putative FCP1-like phosphatase [Zalerion maritima]